MKKFLIYTIALLLLPLLISFSEASFIKAVDCEHCQLVQKNKPSCCHVQLIDVPHETTSAPTKESCPHGGFCKSNAKVPVQVVFTPHVDTSAIHHEFGGAVITSAVSVRLVQASRPPPGAQSVPIYIINCSFLI